MPLLPDVGADGAIPPRRSRIPGGTESRAGIDRADPPEPGTLTIRPSARYTPATEIPYPGPIRL